MTDANWDDSILTKDQYQRIIIELISNSPEQCLSGEDINKAVDEILDMVINAGTIYAWEQGKIHFGWSGKELLFFDPTKSKVDEKFRRKF